MTDFYLPRLGGIERHVSDLATVQRSAGHLVDVITVDGCVEGNTRDLDPSRRPTSSMAGWSPRSIRAARAATLSGGYDIVHVHASLATPMSFAVAAAASRSGIPTVVTMHSLVGGVGPILRVLGAPVRWRTWPIEWTAVSGAAAAELQRALGSTRRVGVLSNAIDVDRWRQHRAAEPDVASPVVTTGQSDSPEAARSLHVVAVMRLTRRKRSMQLLRVLRELRTSTPPDIAVRATIIGDGSCRAAMERFLRRHKMTAWVALAGRRSHHEIRTTLDNADVFVAPATRESFGIAALEARAAGLPVVAMRCSGISEFIEHGRSGLLVDNDQGMVDALRLLAIDAAFRTEIATHNRTVAPPFDWVSALVAVESVYSTATERQSHAPQCVANTVTAVNT